MQPTVGYPGSIEAKRSICTLPTRWDKVLQCFQGVRLDSTQAS